MRSNPLAGIIVLIVILLLSCSSAVNKDHETKDESFKPKPGTYYQAVPCLGDPSVTYALYVPKNYSDTSRLPLIIFFDPRAAGTFPVTRYRELAEKYQVILLGSNNSQNGQPQSETNKIFTSILDDLHARYSYNKEFVVASGFSGGSRIAGILGLYAGGFRGVIGCGAGLPLTDQQPPYTFNYYGIVGNADFNMWEMRDQASDDRFPAKNHELILFSGIHQWPPVSVYELAIGWQLIQCMDGKIIAEDESIRSGYQENMKNLLSLGVVIKPVAGDDKIRKKELDAQKLFYEAIFSKEISWWQSKINNLRKREGVSPSDTLMNHRLLSYLGILCYSVSDRAVKNQTRDALDHALKIYELLEPQNTEIPRFKEALDKMK